jgi:hypothetical protein
MHLGAFDEQNAPSQPTCQIDMAARAAAPNRTSTTTSTVHAHRFHSDDHTPQPSSFPISFSLFSALPIPIQISGWSLRVLEDGRQRLGSPFAEEAQVCDGKVRRRQSRSSISARRARTQFAREQVRFQRGDVCCAEICCTKPPTRL